MARLQSRTMEGAEVLRIRELLGWSQSELAEHINLDTPITVSRWENGHNPAKGPVVVLLEIYEKALRSGGRAGWVRIGPIEAAIAKKKTPAAEAGTAGVQKGS